MQELIVSIMDRFGYAGICLLITVENLFPPIPSEIILPFGGFMTTYTGMSVGGVVLFSTIGSTAGAVMLYGAGTLLTQKRLEALLDKKLFRALGFKKGDVGKTIKWFEKRGKNAVLYGRCVPIIRSLISIPAGMARIDFGLFLFYTVLGSTVWNLMLVSLGAALGASWSRILALFSAYSSLTRLVLWIGIGFVVYLFLKKRVLKNGQS